MDALVKSCGIVFSYHSHMKHLILIPLLLFGVVSNGQSLQQQEDELFRLGRIILEHPEHERRLSANDSFTDILERLISTKEGFEAPLKKVNNMMRLELGKDAAIYTWQIPDSAYRYTQQGLVAARQKDKVEVTRLKAAKPSDAQFKKLKPDEWYGAIYYEAIPVKKGRSTLYTLLGFAPGQQVNEKIIDVIEIDRRGRPRFGDKIFRVENFMDKTLRRAPYRLILSYGGDISASVRWNEDEEMIVMDHLAPPDAKLKGVYRVYGPDMSYDGLTWNDGWWHLQNEVKFNTKQNVPIVPPDKPTDLPPANGGRN